MRNAASGSPNQPVVAAALSAPPVRAARFVAGIAAGLALLLGVPVGAGAGAPAAAQRPAGPGQAAAIVVDANVAAGLVTGVTVRATFAVPVTGAVASLTPVAGLARVLPVQLSTDRRTAEVLIAGDVAAGQAYRLNLRGTADDGSLVQRTVTTFGRAATSFANRSGVRSYVVQGTSAVVGSTGRLFRYTVEAQAPLRSHLQGFVQGALTRLHDRSRGWTAAGRYRLQRVADPAQADIRLLLARPAIVDRLCWRDGLDTGGRYSCWNKEFAAINVSRWLTGGTGARFASLEDYRTYLINHEFGHGLHLHHRYCPRRGALAPAMQQQSSGHDGCRPNGWPYP